MERTEILGIDIGGTGIKAALVDPLSGEQKCDTYRIPTPSSLLPQDVLPVVTQMVTYFNYGGPVGVGFPAVVVDGVPRTPFTAHERQEWLGYPVRQSLEEMTGLPFTVINDADAAGIAEMRFGEGREQKGTVILLTLGTGVGSAVFVDGRLVPNTELGKLYLKNRPFVSEYYCSEAARIREGLKWQAWAEELNLYLAHIEWLFSPQLFILGGGASKKHHKFIPHLTLKTKVVPAGLRNEAGIIGAAMSVLANPTA